MFSFRHKATLSTATLNSLITSYLEKKSIAAARTLFDNHPLSRSRITWNTMTNGYVQIGQIKEARDLFDQMPDKDVVSWNIMLTGYKKTNDANEAYRCLLRMIRADVRPNDYTVSTVLGAVLGTVFDVLVRQVHALAVCLALNMDSFVGSALIKGYVSLGDKSALVRTFDDIVLKAITSWNSLIFGYMRLGDMTEAQKVFDAMPERSIVSWTTLVNGYIWNNRIDKAELVFNNMNERNVVSWTAMISGYVQQNRFEDALKLFVLMLESGMKPNHYTFSSVLDACADWSSLLTGQQVHAGIIKYGTPVDVILSTSLVDMYAKCGNMDAACFIFESMLNKNLVSWNAIIGGFARHGFASQALEQFGKMERDGFRPNEVTFVNVLSACVHGGLIEEGEKQFCAMITKYNIQPELEHYTCMVDLFGRAGQLDKAENFINQMPLELDVVVWGTLLTACSLHWNIELGEFAAEKINKLKSDHPAAYSLLSQIYSAKDTWNKINELRKMMKLNHVKKQRARSWLNHL